MLQLYTSYIPSRHSYTRPAIMDVTSFFVSWRSDPSILLPFIPHLRTGNLSIINHFYPAFTVYRRMRTVTVIILLLVSLHNAPAQAHGHPYSQIFFFLSQRPSACARTPLQPIFFLPFTAHWRVRRVTTLTHFLSSLHSAPAHAHGHQLLPHELKCCGPLHVGPQLHVQLYLHVAQVRSHNFKFIYMLHIWVAISLSSSTYCTFFG